MLVDCVTVISYWCRFAHLLLYGDVLDARHSRLLGMCVSTHVCRSRRAFVCVRARVRVRRSANTRWDKNTIEQIVHSCLRDSNCLVEHRWSSQLFAMPQNDVV